MGRLFLAGELPEKVRTRLSEEAERLRLSAGRVLWTRPLEYHFTLHFFGDIDDQALLDLDGPLMELFATTRPLGLVARGLRSFPTDDPRPRVLYCGLIDQPAEEGALAKLWSEVQTLVQGLGLKRERPPFEPHITLGRVKSEEGIQDLVERMGPANRREFAHFRCEEIVLFESMRFKEGIVHTPLRRFRLRGENRRPV